MSWVANVLLSVDWCEDAALVAEFDRWLQAEAPRREQPGVLGVGSINPLHDIVEAWGGPKNPEALIWARALNHADVEAMVLKFASMPWQRPDLVQLLIQDQEQGAFRLWMIRDGAAMQFAPLSDHDSDP